MKGHPVDFTAEPTTTEPAQWYPLVATGLTTAEADALEAAGGRVENAYVAHQCSLRHQAASDRAPCAVCHVLAEAMITLLGLAGAARFLPVGSEVKYHGVITSMHGLYTVAGAGWDGPDVYYHLSDYTGQIVLRGVDPEDVTPL